MPKNNDLNSFLSNLMNAVDPDAKFWIGLNDKHTEGEWLWEDGSPHDPNVDWGYWGVREPNNQGGEDCAIRRSTDWNDVTCSAYRKFICQVVPECHFGYTAYDGECFKVYDQAKTYDQSRQVCAADGGLLAMPKTSDLNEFLWNLRSPYQTEGSDFWIGLNDLIVEGDWLWEDGTPHDVTADWNNWNSGEPNNLRGAEDCGQLFEGGSVWNDDPCGRSHKFLCQVTQGRTANVALGRPTEQSSLHPTAGGEPHLAVDGNTNGHYFSLSCTHTVGELNPWWRVDLGHSLCVERVVLYNRMDCCWDRLRQAIVHVGDNIQVDSNPSCGAPLTAIEGVQPYTAVCPGLIGRYVGVRIGTTNLELKILTLCEVKVYGGVVCPVTTAPANGFMNGSTHYQEQAQLACDTGYSLIGVSNVICQLDRQWTGSTSATCEAIECPSVSPNANCFLGSSDPQPWNYGDVVNFWCDSGYNLTGASSITCQVDGTWSGIPPTCTAIQCPMLTGPANGMVIYPGSNFFGDVVTFSCDTGYSLVGTSMLTCQADGTWSGDRPTCIVVQCQTISPPLNGMFSPTDGANTYQDQLRFACDLAYVLVGAASITCQADGTWSDNAPICSAVQCPPLAAPANGARTGSNSYQDVVTFTCNLGYVLVGSASLTCQADATWSGNVPTCPPVQCPTLLPPINGGVSGFSLYQDVLTFTCDPGYELEGSASLTCQADATWSGVEPTCTRVQCLALPPPVNGDSTGSNFYLDVVHFTCNSGYELVGDSSSTCQADRTWSNNVPSCNAVQCPILTAPVNGAITGNNYYQDVVTFLCDPGYDLVGIPSLTCQADATWSGIVPTCTRIQCPALPSPMNGDSSGPNYYQDVVQFTCDPGYDLVGESSSTCQADRTWSSNVPSCNDIDECSATNGGCDHVCTNTLGSFQCSCVDGFNLNADGHSCDDIDECINANGGCEQNCHNFIGSYLCTCGAGYTLDTDSHTCADVDECYAASGGCDQLCTNTAGSFQCSCGNGYSLNGDGFGCDGEKLLQSITSIDRNIVSPQG
ncbi:E-selectin-like [Branchiostoma floridae x Branchiostoma belcheri]